MYIVYNSTHHITPRIMSDAKQQITKKLANTSKVNDKTATSEAKVSTKQPKQEIKQEPKQETTEVDPMDLYDLMPERTEQEPIHECNDEPTKEKYPSYDSLTEEKQKEQRVLIKKMLDMLSPDRHNKPGLRKDILYILADTSESLKDLANYFIKKFKPDFKGLKDNYWGEIVGESIYRRLKLGSLHFYAKNDNPTEYKKMFEKVIKKTTTKEKGKNAVVPKECLVMKLEEKSKAKAQDKNRELVFEAKEIFNQHRLKYIIENFEEFSSQLNSTHVEDCKKQIAIAKTYLHKSKNGMINVKCYQTNGHGRMFADQSLSLCNLDRRIRHTIAGDLYYDIDVVNAHPVFLLHLCKLHDIPCANLEFLVNNRDKFFSEIISRTTKLPVDRETAKRQVLIYTNSEPNKNFNDVTSPRLEQYRSEMASIQEAFKETFADEFEKHKEYVTYHKKREKNFNGSFMNMKLCTLENNVLHAIIAHFGNPEVVVGCFDGSMLTQKDGPYDLTSAEEFIYNELGFSETGIRPQLKIKPMTEGFKLPPDDELELYVDVVRKYTDQDYDDMNGGDSGMAEVFIRYNKDVKVINEKGKCYIYNTDTALWEPKGVLTMRNKITEVLKAVAAEWVSNFNDVSLIKEVKAGYKRACSGACAEAVGKMVIGSCIDVKFPLTLNNNTANKHLFPITGKLVVNCMTGKTEPRQRKHLFTHEAPVSLVSDKEIAKYKVEKFVSQIYEDDEEGITEDSLTTYIQQLLGVSLTGVSTRELYILHGKGRNGKSTILDIMGSIMGEFMSNIPQGTVILTGNKKRDAAAHTADLETLRNIRLAVIDEFDEGAVLDPKNIKNIVSGNIIKSRKCGGEEFDNIKPYCKLLLATNEIINYNINDEAMCDRVNYAKHGRQFCIKGKPKKGEIMADKDFADSFLSGDARNAFFSWIVKGVVRYFASGLDKAGGNIKRSKHVDEYTELIKGQMDPLGLFLADEDYIEKDEDALTQVSTFYKELCKYAELNKIPLNYSSNKLTPIMRARGYKDKRCSKGNCYVGFKIAGSVKVSDEMSPEDLGIDIKKKVTKPKSVGDAGVNEEPLSDDERDDNL